MAANQVKFTLKFTDDGGIELVGKKADKAAKSMGKMSDATDQVNKRKRRYNKVEKGVAGATSNSTKAFTKQAGAIQGGLVPAYAILASNVFAVTAAFGVLQRSAALEQLEAGLISVGNASGRNLPFIANELTKITDNAISAEAAMRATAVATSSGFSSSQLMDLTRVAKGASLALGRNLPDALDRLVRGTAKLEPEILDELGILVRIDDATREYAQRLNKTATELTTFERQQAFLNATIEQGQKKFSLVTQSIPVNEFDRLAATFSDATQEILKFVNEGLGPLIRLLADSPATLMTLTGTIGAMGLSTLVTPLTEMAQGSADAAQSALDKMNKTSGKTRKEFKNLAKGISTFDFAPPSIKAMEGDIKKGTIETAKLKKGITTLKTSEVRMNNKNKTIVAEIKKLEKEGGARSAQKLKTLRAQLGARNAQIAANHIIIEQMGKMVKIDATGGAVSGARLAAGAGMNAAMTIRSELMETIAGAGFFASLTAVFKSVGNTFGEVFGKGLSLGGRFYLLLSTIKTLGLGLVQVLAKFAGPIGLAVTTALILYNVFSEKIDPILTKISGLFGFGEKAESDVAGAAKTFESFTGIAQQLDVALKNNENSSENFVSILKVQVGLFDQLGTAIRLMNQERLDNVQKKISIEMGKVNKAIQKQIELTATLDKIQTKQDAEREARRAKGQRKGRGSGSDTSGKREAKQQLADTKAITKTSLSIVQTAQEDSLKITTETNTKFLNLLFGAQAQAEAAAKGAVEKETIALMTNYAATISKVREEVLASTLENRDFNLNNIGQGDFLDLFPKEWKAETIHDYETLWDNLGMLQKKRLAAIEIGPELFSNINKELISFSKKAEGPFASLSEKFKILATEANAVIQKDSNDPESAVAFLKQVTAEGDNATGMLKAMRKAIAATDADYETKFGGVDDLVSEKDIQIIKQYNTLFASLVKNIETRKKESVEATAAAKEGAEIAKLEPTFIGKSLKLNNDAAKAKMAAITAELVVLTKIANLTDEDGKATKEALEANQKILDLERKRADIKTTQVSDGEIRLRQELAELDIEKERLKISQLLRRIQLIGKKESLKLSQGGLLSAQQEYELELEGLQTKNKFEKETRDFNFEVFKTQQKLVQEKIKENKQGKELSNLEKQVIDLSNAKIARQELQNALLDAEGEKREKILEIVKKITNAEAQRDRLSSIGGSVTAGRVAFGTGSYAMDGLEEVYSTFKEGSKASATEKMKEAVVGLTFALGGLNEANKAIVESYGEMGEAVMQMTEGFELLIGSVASLGDANSPTDILGSIGMAIGAIGQIAAASAKQEVAAIDKQIAAEKKRDGSSRESLSKIAALEKKKEQSERKAFERKKKTDSAQIVISTAVAMMETYKNLGGFPFGAIGAAIIGAIGAKQLQVVQSATYDGGGSGTADSGPMGVTVGERQNKVDFAQANNTRGEIAYARGESGIGTGMSNFRARPAYMGKRYRAVGGYTTGFMVGEQGPELFMPDTPGEIVAADETQDMLGGGSTNVNFTISAIDAQGVEQVLLDQRENIIGMIRDAANGNGTLFLEGVN